MSRHEIIPIRRGDAGLIFNGDIAGLAVRFIEKRLEDGMFRVEVLEKYGPRLCPSGAKVFLKPGDTIFIEPEDFAPDVCTGR